jgi:hypothetical protein
MDLGRLGMQRGADQQRRVAAIIQHYQAIDPDTKVIDFKQFTEEGMGAWWRDSRGVNDFEQVKTLILCGTPLPQFGRFAGGVCHLDGRV